MTPHNEGIIPINQQQITNDFTLPLVNEQPTMKTETETVSELSPKEANILIRDMILSLETTSSNFFLPTISKDIIDNTIPASPRSEQFINNPIETNVTLSIVFDSFSGEFILKIISQKDCYKYILPKDSNKLKQLSSAILSLYVLN